MAAALEAIIGVQHGPDCICRLLDPISVSVQPVVVDRACPAQGELPRSEEPVGRIVITWPARKNGHAPLAVMAVSFQDADSGEQLTTVTGLRLVIGTKRGWDGAIEVDLEQLADADGNPLPSGAPVVPNDDGNGVRTGVFRYAVAEMRIAEDGPVDSVAGSVETEYDLDTGIRRDEPQD